jgi:hypothetical protein
MNLDLLVDLSDFLVYMAASLAQGLHSCSSMGTGYRYHQDGGGLFGHNCAEAF